MTSPRLMSADETAALRRVQRRTAAIVFFVMAIHGVLGLIVVAEIIYGQDRADDAAILVFMSGVLAIGVCIATRVILGAAKVASVPWMVASLLPTVVGYFWIFA